MWPRWRGHRKCFYFRLHFTKLKMHVRFTVSIFKIDLNLFAPKIEIGTRTQTTKYVSLYLPLKIELILFSGMHILAHLLSMVKAKESNVNDDTPYLEKNFSWKIHPIRNNIQNRHMPLLVICLSCAVYAMFV